jgi:hypothetical protein
MDGPPLFLGRKRVRQRHTHTLGSSHHLLSESHGVRQPV